MFTGIIEEIGIVKGITKTMAAISLKVKTEKIYSDVKTGDSIAVNGACLSVVDIKDNILTYDVIPETLKRTTLGDLKINDPVNLERSMKIDARIGGHFISGHIDYKARVNEMVSRLQGVGFKITLPKEFSRFVVEKGSIALDGVSLTVAAVAKEDFTVYLIPHTLKHTTFGRRKKGDLINVETDIIGKYVAKDSVKPSDFQDILRQYGYI